MPIVTDVTSYEDFKSLISAPNLSVFHFWASWADQCGPMNHVLELLSEDEDLKKEAVTFHRVEAEKLNRVSLENQISAVPVFLIFRDGKLLTRIDGAKAAELTKSVKTLAKNSESVTKVPIPPPKEKKADDLDSRLKALINSHECMLFMKGNPKEPKCGFSRQTVAILEDLNADFGTFDILTDEEVRQGLKTYSNWQTYPQLYIHGELIGGLDIIKEMADSGDLQGIIPKKPENLDEKLKTLINRASLMIFMKGDSSAPKCGFSRQLIEILNETGFEYKTFNIMEDDEVRQGLKKFSNWPTYPQVYVKGELIGGLDIIKELKESNELNATLQGNF